VSISPIPICLADVGQAGPNRNSQDEVRRGAWVSKDPIFSRQSWQFTHINIRPQGRKPELALLNKKYRPQGRKPELALLNKKYRPQGRKRLVGIKNSPGQHAKSPGQNSQPGRREKINVFMALAHGTIETPKQIGML